MIRKISVLDALYADISVDAEEMDINPEELDSAMKEMDEEINREEQSDKAVTSRQVFVAIGIVMEEDQTGQAPPRPRDNRKGPAVDAKNDHAKAMPPLANPAQQP